MDLADRLQELRKKAGYSQEQVADMLGLSRQAISKWESRQGKPEIDNIIKLTEIYHVSADYILLGIDHSARQRLRRAPLTNRPPTDHCRGVFFSAGFGFSRLSILFDGLCLTTGFGPENGPDGETPPRSGPHTKRKAPNLTIQRFFFDALAGTRIPGPLIKSATCAPIVHV